MLVALFDTSFMRLADAFKHVEYIYLTAGIIIVV